VEKKEKKRRNIARRYHNGRFARPLKRDKRLKKEEGNAIPDCKHTVVY